MKTRAVPLSAILMGLFVAVQADAAAVPVVSGADTYLVADNGVDSSVGTGVTSLPVDTNTDHYSEPGQFGGQDAAGQPDSWNGDRRWGNDGIGTSALYEFTGLVDGTYNVYSSWRNPPQNNVSLAHYEVSDGGPSIDIDQRLGATALSELVLNDGARDIDFALVGTVTVNDGDLFVSVDDSTTGNADANSFIFSDAIAIGPVPVPEPAACLLILAGAFGFRRLRRRRR